MSLELHEEIDIKIEPFEEHDTEFDSNETFGQNTTLSGNEMDTDNIEIGVEDVKPFEIIEVENETLLAEPVTDNSLTCGKSNKEFNSYINLYELHCPNKCSICNANFSTQYNLKIHLLNIHSDDKPFYCSLCSNKFLHKSKLKRHLVNTHELDKDSVASIFKESHSYCTYFCKICDVIFNSNSHLQEHIQAFHQNFMPFKCNECGKGFTTQSSLNSHSTILSGEKPYKCSICSQDFRLEKCLTNHLNNTHKQNATTSSVQNIQPIFSIVQKKHKVYEKCNVQFSSHENLSQHVCTIQDNVKIEPFEEHDREFVSNETFGQNITLSGNEMDTDNIKIGVEDMNSFKIVEEVQMESLLAEPDTDNSFTCEICNKEFSSYKNLQQHILDLHCPWKCPKCNDTFVSKSGLNSHLRTHNEIKPVSCPLCNYKCIRKYQLKVHLLTTHKLDKNSVASFLLKPPSIKEIQSYRIYVCKICDVILNSQSHFQHHIQAFHQNFKPFKCKVCGEGFNTHSNLNSHSTIHCVEKPYKCSICSQDFRLMDDLRKHFRIAHYVDEQLNQPDARKTNLFNVDNMSLLANSDNSNYQCDVCHKVCISLDELKEHKIVHNCSLAYFNCNKCCIFDIFENLEKHIATNHTEDSSFKCSVCNATFKSLQKFRTHVSYMHENTIEEPQNLMVIVSSDSINESVKCEICKQDFNNRTSLKCHFNKMHTNNKDLKCDLCGKTYWRDGILQRHCDNFHKTANLTSGLQRPPPKHQLCQSTTRNKVRQPDYKLTASSLPEMWITKVKPCCILLDRGEVTRYLSRLDKREVTEERGSPIEGLPPPLATPAPPVRDDPRHPCGAVSVTSDFLLGAATSTLENVRQQENYSKRESYVEPNFVLDDCKLNSDNANLSSNHSYTNGNEGVNQNLENFEEMFIKTEPIVLEMSDIVDPLSVCTVNNDREISNDMSMEQSVKEGLSQINDHDNNIFQNDNKIVRKESNTSINISSDKEASTYKLRCIYCDVCCSAASELEIHMKKDHNITCKIPFLIMQ